MIKHIIRLFSLVTAFSAMQAQAAPISWTDWTTETGANSAIGELLVGATTVDVRYSGTGNHAFIQNGVSGNLTNYWTEPTLPAAYTSGTADNAPPAAELVALNQGGIVTVSFSQAILNPYIAMNSWNNNIVDFGETITVDSVGRGFWGVGSAILNGSNTGFSGSGEFHGVITLQGAFNSISFSHTSENWHGFTIGVAGLAPPSNNVPEPASLALLGLGLLGLGFMRRRRG